MSLPITDRDALILTILGEARNQGYSGMEAVGWTILNRVARQGWQGKTILEVCLKPWQYSCWNENDPNRDYLINNADGDIMYSTACKIADGLIAGNITDITDGAVSYYSNDIPAPDWAKDHNPCCIIEKLIMFNDIA